jgi:hypothetical protein
MTLLPGYALAATAYIVTWRTGGRALGSAPTDDDLVRQLYELVGKRLDDDDHLGMSYVDSSPRSAKAHRVLAEEIEHAARNHSPFEAALRSAADGLRQAGAADRLSADDATAVVYQIANSDRRGADVFRPGLAAAIGPAAADAMLGPAGAARAATAAANRPGPTPFQILYYAAALLAAAGLLISIAAAVAFDSQAGILAGIAMMALGAPVAGILHRQPRLRGV